MLHVLPTLVGGGRIRPANLTNRPPLTLLRPVEFAQLARSRLRLARSKSFLHAMRVQLDGQ